VTSWLPLITGSGGALVVLAIWIGMLVAGQLHTDKEFTKLEERADALETENDALRDAIETERRAASDVARAGAVTNQLIAALTGMAAQKKHLPPPDITPEDLGFS